MGDLQRVRGNVLKRTVQALKPLVDRALSAHGEYVFADIERKLPSFRARTIFDVGANIGEVANRFAAQFEEATIYCFEPVPQTYSILTGNVHGDRFKCNRLALSSTESTAKLRRRGHDGLFSLEGPQAGPDEEALDEVFVTTLDAYCARNQITHIDYLKLDAGGHDLEVLKGGTGLFSSHAIEFIEAEAGRQPDSQVFSRLEAIQSFLEGYDYGLFGIYEQVSDSRTQEPSLRRVNPVFISRKLIESNRLV